MRVLVVDDNRDFAEVLAEVLSTEGHQCVMAFSGEEALEKAKQSQFDVAFLDLMLPGIDGCETAQGLRELQPGVRVVMVTGYSDEKYLARMAPGATVLLKPVSLATVSGILEEEKGRPSRAGG